MLFVFTIVTWMWNSFVVLELASWTDTDGKRHPRKVDGLPYKIAMVLNGWVVFLGLALLITAGFDYDAAGTECAKKGLAEKDCNTPWSIVFMAFVGVCVSGCASAALCGVYKSGSWLMVTLLRIAQLAYAVLALILIVICVVFSLSAGTIETLNQVRIVF